MQKEVYVLGPLLPPRYGTEAQNSEEGASVDIKTFLREILVQHESDRYSFLFFLLHSN